MPGLQTLPGFVMHSPTNRQQRVGKTWSTKVPYLKLFAYLICLFTMQLLWGYNDDYKQ